MNDRQHTLSIDYIGLYTYMYMYEILHSYMNKIRGSFIEMSLCKPHLPRCLDAGMLTEQPERGCAPSLYQEGIGAPRESCLRH